MPQRRILFLDNAHLTAYRVGAGVVQAEGEFSATPLGIEAFGTYLTQHRGSVFMLLADVAEEGFQLEDIPHTGGKDRAALIKRKLSQYFYGTPLALAITQGRRKEGRRDEHLLLLALTRPQHFEPWLTALRATEAMLAGIYSLPQTMTGLLPTDTPPHVLLITLTRGGLRQTFFANHQLRFSRLTALATGSQEEVALAATQEAAKMHQYLVGQRLIEHSKPLLTRILAHPAQSTALRAHCRDTAALQFEFIDLLQETRHAGMHTALADSYAEKLFCHLLAKNTPADQFAPPAERQFHRLWQTRFALNSASVLILIGALLFAAKLGGGILQLQNTIDGIEQQTHLDQQRYDTALQALPEIPLTTENLRALVGRYEEVLKRATGPEPLLIQLSQSLNAFQDIEIERIEWSIAEQLAPAPATPLPPNMTSGPYAQARVDARLPLGIIGNQRDQLSLVASFVKHLGTAPATLVTVLQQPVDTQSGQTLKSSDETRTQDAPRFSFHLIRKL